jgi:uncharacterized protein
MKASYPFTVMVKPIGSACNMACRYCYYLGNEISMRRPMSEQTMEAMIRNYFESSPGPVVSFIWHGGEPTLRGLDFFKMAVELEKKYLPQGYECWNNLQTNGLELNEEWCAFLRKEHFDVGLSIDGNRMIHDYYRRDAKGNETYDRIRDHIALLMRYGIRPDLLCTVNRMTCENACSVYQNLKELNTGWMQFIPIVNMNEDGSLSEDSVDVEGYGNFLKTVFYQWLYNDLDKLGVQLFMEMLQVYAGSSQTLCWLQKECGDVPVVESNGNVYSCDHFVRDEHYLGNILETSLAEIMEGKKQRDFGRAKALLPEKCGSCDYLKICHGGCLKDRNRDGCNVLCESYLEVFKEAEEPLKKAAMMMRERIPFKTIMEELRKDRDLKWKDVSGNAPCPCGSGRKYKHCCGR